MDDGAFARLLENPAGDHLIRTAARGDAGNLHRKRYGQERLRFACSLLVCLKTSEKDV